jgi:hypothetical protein
MKPISLQKFAPLVETGKPLEKKEFVDRAKTVLNTKLRGNQVIVQILNALPFYEVIKLPSGQILLQ